MTDEALAELAQRLGLATPAQLEQARRRQRSFAAAGKQVDLLAALEAGLPPAAREALRRAATGATPAAPAPAGSATVAPAPRPVAAPAPAGPAGAAQGRIALHGRGLSPGDRVGPYVVVRELARGGMGVVLEAAQPGAGRRVALKVRLAPPGADRRGAERFLVEARAGARVQHPGVVAIHDVGEDEAGRQYLAMDLVDGESLERTLAREGPLEPRRAAGLCRDLARALAHAHRLGVLHRDLKPANVILRASDGAPLLVDFGLAKLVEGAESLTRTGEVMGTPMYMPPEQAAGDRAQVDARSDVWSLGATLYHLLAGRPPFHGAGVVPILAAVLRGRHEPVRAARPDVPPALAGVVERCLSKPPVERYQTMDALADDLERWLETGETSAAEELDARRRARAGRLVGAALATVLLAGLAGAAAAPALLSRPPAPPRPVEAPPRESEPPPRESEPSPPARVTDAPPPVVPAKEAYFRPGLWVPARTEGAPHPPPRCSHAMAYDSGRRRVVLFGGHDGKRILDDQWSWDGVTWREETPPVRPEQRFVHAMVHDEARGRLVVLGGNSIYTGTPDLVDVWEREGERWTAHRPAGPTPLPRSWAGATWDATNHRVLLFGGVDAAGETRGDLWAWDGARWTPLETEQGPGPRSEAMLAWDAARGRLLVCGAADGPAMGELWEWSPGSGWSRTELPPGLGPRGHPGLVALRRGALLFAGNGPSGGKDDTWTWDGQAWTSRQCGFGGTLPPARTWHALAYDADRDVVVLFGGYSGGKFLEDTWQLQPDW